MPYRNESRSRPYGSVAIGHRVTQNGTPYVSYGDVPGGAMVQSQFGFRSEGEEKAASADLITAQNSAAGWGDTAELTAHFDRLYAASTSQPRVFRDSQPSVHERKYVEVEHRAIPLRTSLVSKGREHYSIDSAHYLSVNLPTLTLTDEALGTIGSQLIRDSRPTTPHSNLTQWFGELRETRSLARPIQMPPEFYDFAKHRTFLDEVKRFRRGGAATGSAYLAGQFGWLPFVGEVLNAVDSTHNARRHLSQWARDSGRIVKRSRHKVLDQGVFTLSSTNVGKNSSSATTLQSKGIVNNGVSITHGLYKGAGLSKFYADIETTVAWTTSVRAGARFQYFAADPDGVLGKLESASQQIKLLYGDPLMSLSTAWELLPWSWLVDYHTDIGGLLSYQQSVEEDSLVARSSYTVYEQVASAVSRLSTRYDGNYVVTGSSINGVSAKRQRRLKGTPYALFGDPVDLSPRQWAILGALGLTKGPGVKGDW